MFQSAHTQRVIRCGLFAVLMSSCAPAALHAEPSLSELAAEIKALKSANDQMRVENHQMKAAIAELRGDGRRTRETIRKVVAGKTPPAVAPPLLVGSGAEVPVTVRDGKRLQVGEITITPGGFLAMESVFRSRTQQADIGTQYQGIPFGPQAATNEERFSARQSRVALLAEGRITPTMLASGYGELDFLGSGVTSNGNESNSFVPRVRHLYATLDAEDYGLHVLAGQNWSLVTMNSKGITPRNEVTPPSIDAQYVPGFSWKRQPQIRLTKDFGKKLWFAVSAEAPQNTITGCTAGVNGTTVNGRTVTCDILGVNNLNGIAGTTTTNFSLNHVPDVVGKAAYEAQLGERSVHLEAFGMYRDLYDRVADPASMTAQNRNTSGWGVGGGMIVQLIPKRLDGQISGMVGRGIGSYGTAQFTDATFNSDGSLSPLREEMVLAGLTYHATSAVDIYAFGGLEQVQPNYFTTTSGALFGYGIPTADNSGCFNEVTGGSCAGNAKRIWQVTGGFWDKLYRGRFGEVRAGVQYSYTERQLFAGLPLSVYPKQDEHSVFTSLRYYPFQ